MRTPYALSCSVQPLCIFNYDVTKGFTRLMLPLHDRDESIGEE